MESKSFRERVIRLAHEMPSLRPHLLPILKEAGRDTMDFVTWALDTQPLVSTGQVISFLERHGIPLVESSSSPRGKPITVGEPVQVQAVNAPSHLRDLLEPYDLRKGVVTQVHGNDIRVDFSGLASLFVPGGVFAGKASGIYRTVVVSEEQLQNSIHVEVVYVSAKEKLPSQVSLQRLQDYIEQGMARGEERSSNYYSGYVSNYKISGSNDPYFTITTQQRGGDMRTLSPNKGQVYYIGIVGRRPGGWKAELARAQAEDNALAVG